MSEQIFVDIHILQTVPPSCVNRDDTGSPKTAVYGGTTRARVSSQAWKHAMRTDFLKRFPQGELGKRTKHVVELVKNDIILCDPTVEQSAAEKMAMDALSNAGLKIKSAESGTDALFFISEKQVRAIAELAVAKEKDKKKYSAALKENPSIDMILFGRMVASDPSLNYDATAQVAHSISTHTVHNEYDYFTAVDDCAREDNAGAGHLGTVEFNSATLYRYATVNAGVLAGFAGKEAVNAIERFAESFIYSMPTGRENTFANRTLPSDIYICVRTDQPVNLCGAFERPVRAGQDDYVPASEKAFVEYAKNLYAAYDNAPDAEFGMGDGIGALVQPTALPDVLSQLREYLEHAIGSDQS